MIKILHISCALLSFTGFFVRGMWMIFYPDELQQRWVKIAPHVIDTLLLGNAVFLAIQLHISPLQHSWLAAKILALIVYILLGSVALKHGKTQKIRITAWVCALLTISYIISVALTKSPTIIG